MSNQLYRVPLHTRWMRSILRPIFRGIFHIISHVKISGRENVPSKGAYLIAINHVSLFEPPFVLAFWPIAPEAAGAADIWERRGQSLLARSYGGIPVRRGEYDRNLIDLLLNVLKSGRPLVIAPEGGRSHSPGMKRALPGAAYLADQAGVPVVPVGILGAVDDFLASGLRGKRPTIEMRIGQPFRLTPITSKGEARRILRQKNADQIMLHIAALLPPEYQGVYGRGFDLDGEAARPAAETRD